MKELIKKIWEAELDKKIDLRNMPRVYLSYVKFEQVPISKIAFELRGLYSWTAQSEGGQWVFPLKNLNYVKFFKTLKGAKRNFIKNYLKEV